MVNLVYGPDLKRTKDATEKCEKKDVPDEEFPCGIISLTGQNAYDMLDQATLSILVEINDRAVCDGMYNYCGPKGEIKRPCRKTLCCIIDQARDRLRKCSPDTVSTFLEKWEQELELLRPKITKFSTDPLLVSVAGTRYSFLTSYTLMFML